MKLDGTESTIDWINEDGQGTEGKDLRDMPTNSLYMQSYFQQSV